MYMYDLHCRASSVQPPATGSRATSPANQDGGGVGGAGGGANNHDDNSGDGRIVPTLRIGVDGKIIVDETRYVVQLCYVVCRAYEKGGERERERGGGQLV